MSKKSKNGAGISAGAQSVALSELEYFLEIGNFVLTRAVARKIISSDISSSIEKDQAQRAIRIATLDPMPLALGIATLIVLLVTTLLVT